MAMSAKLELDLDALDNIMYILAYDVPSENIKRLTIIEKRLLVSKRWSIRNELRYTYGAALLQKSIWRINENAVDAVNDRVVKWLEWYAEKGFTAKIRLFPIGTTDAGYSTFLEMEHDCILGWLISIEELLQDAISKKVIMHKALNEHQKKVAVLDTIVEQDFGRNSPDYEPKRYKALKEELDFVKDSLGTVQQVAKVKKYGS